jgi:tetratricopeptide (TPR) repeat protein
MRFTFPLTSLLFLFAFLSNSSAQGIEFEKGSWTEAVKKARKQKKLLFLQFDSPSCGPCSDVVAIAFSSPLVREKFAQHFVSYRIDGTTGLGKELADKLAVECVPSSLYLDADENPLARQCNTTSFDRAYLEKAEEALVKSRQKPLKALAEAYEKGDRSSALMREYIIRRREMGLPTDDLLDTYVRQLPADSLKSAGLSLFIFEQGAIVGSRADSIFRSNRVLNDSLYRAVGVRKAIEYNALAVNNSIKKAISKKNFTLAYRTASFRQRTYGTDVLNGTMAADWVMIRYYRGTKDTLRFLMISSHYYDRYFMNAKVDSVQKLDELDMQRRMRGTSSMTSSQKPGSTGLVSVMPYPNTQRYVTALNQAAWDFYQMTRDTKWLTKAAEWSKRSLEFREDASLMDTYAHLLYRLGRKEEALEWQNKAVKKEESANSPLMGTLRESLQKMKDGTL